MASPDRRRTYHARLVAELGAGHTLKDAAASAGISERSARRWLAAHRAEVFRNLVERATSWALSKASPALLLGKR